MDKVVSFKFRGFQTENFEVDVETAGKLLEMQAELIHNMQAILAKQKNLNVNPQIQRGYLDLIIVFNGLYAKKAPKAMPIDMIEEVRPCASATKWANPSKDQLAGLRAAYYGMLRNMKRSDALIRLSERFSIPWQRVAELID